MIAHTSSAAIRSGPPQRGASRKRSATVPRTPAPESHRARQALTVLRQIPSLSAVPSIPRPSPKSNTMRARIASCCGVKDARIRRSSPSRSSSLNSILAALRPISSLHREIIATENQTTENKSLICESELTPTCTSAAQWKRRLHWRLKDGSDLSRFPGFVCEMWLAHDILWFSGSKSLIHRMSLATMEWSDGSLVRRPDRAWRRGAPRPGRSHARPYHAAADGVARAHDPALR